MQLPVCRRDSGKRICALICKVTKAGSTLGGRLCTAETTRNHQTHACRNTRNSWLQAAAQRSAVPDGSIKPLLKTGQQGHQRIKLHLQELAEQLAPGRGGRSVLAGNGLFQRRFHRLELGACWTADTNDSKLAGCGRCWLAIGFSSSASAVGVLQGVQSQGHKYGSDAPRRAGSTYASVLPCNLHPRPHQQ